MDDLPARFADFLEQIATTVRSVTVDRAAGWARMVALGIVATVLVMMAVWFILVGLVRLLSTWIAVKYLYAIIGGLFVIAGALLWSRRTPKETS
ncbi:MAG: hypothetical protein KJN81_06035 [Acidimicrobiia bacterium]|nr:hypothetical protein [Acidimicrobiia bacterium]NNC42948.1 hypothetical protein [Acidimicrobiia bacterium]NNL27973.1 hypothetical protein [Acidimicrobiia bacterium]